MAVKIRMTRLGRRHRPFFRINAIDSRSPRDGKILEKLGHFDPLEKDQSKQVVLDHEKVKQWLAKGAIPSDTISELLVREGIENKFATQKESKMSKARAIARKKGKPFNAAEKKALADAKAKEAEAPKA
jgi:small subunit ribosomal protein S16